ncbi:MAG: phosphoribosylanthranilate isomerase [bacterium]|nr:phosphoribosylanthranilate isomerase [bacterium]
MTRIKICGMRGVEDALAAVEAGADALGVILAASPRRVGLEEVAEIRRAVPPFIPLVGVFVDPKGDEVRAALAAGVDVLQFSGGESPAFCRGFARPHIKVFHVGEHAPDRSRIAAYQGAMPMFDTAGGQLPGGTGTPFAWSLLEPLRDCGPFVVAGGLQAESVGEPIAMLRPFAVDVSSGVERDGRKSPELMRAFVRAVRESDATAR